MKTMEILKQHLEGIVLQYGHHSGLSKEEAAYFYIGPPEEVATGVWHFYSLANSVTFLCGDWLMQVDCNIAFRAQEVITAIRERTGAPFDILAITHGHVDHCMGTYFYLEHSKKRGDERPRVVGHKNLRSRINKN